MLLAQGGGETQVWTTPNFQNLQENAKYLARLPFVLFGRSVARSLGRSVGRSVGPSVRPSVRPSLFDFFKIIRKCSMDNWWIDLSNDTGQLLTH